MAEGIGNSPVRPYDVGVAQTPIGFYKTLFRLHDASLKHCVPAIVKKYDRASGTVVVLPLVKTVIDTMSGEELKDRPEYTVPVRRICHGGFIIDVPLFVGDTGWLIAADRSCDEARADNSTRLLENDDKEDPQNKGPKRPDTLALGDFAWGFFLPDYWGKTDLTERDGLAIVCTPSENAQGKPFKITAGDLNITIQRGEDGAEKTDRIILDDDGLRYEGTPDREQEVIADIRYDLQTHQIQKKTFVQKIRGDFVVGNGEVGGWTLIEGGQAVPETVE